MANEEKIIVPVLGGLALLFILSGDSGKAPITHPAPGVDPLTPIDFIKKYWGSARKSEITTEVPALVTMAQAAQESGWGRYAHGNNYFGIKDSSAWTGATQKLLTWECGRTGNAATDNITDTIIKIYAPGASTAPCKGMYSYRVRAVFRKYPTAQGSFNDHGMFLRKNPRYVRAFIWDSPNPFLAAVAAAGYATDPQYYVKTRKLMDLIRDELKRQNML